MFEKSCILLANINMQDEEIKFTSDLMIQDFNSRMIFPFVCKQMREIAYDDKVYEAFSDAAVYMDLPKGFKSAAPISEIERKNLDRWLLKEPGLCFGRMRMMNQRLIPHFMVRRKVLDSIG